jgi:hypothetical protein
MKHKPFILPGTAWLWLAATGLLVMGCASRGTWDGVYTVDRAGRARVCVAQSAEPPDGQTVAARVQVSDEGGWCGVTATRNGRAFDSYLLVIRPRHGRVLAHRVGAITRIDYTPDPGYVGSDRLAVRMLPGNGVVEEVITVTR